MPALLCWDLQARQAPHTDMSKYILLFEVKITLFNILLLWTDNLKAPLTAII